MDVEPVGCVRRSTSPESSTAASVDWEFRRQISEPTSVARRGVPSGPSARIRASATRTCAYAGRSPQRRAEFASCAGLAAGRGRRRPRGSPVPHAAALTTSASAVSAVAGSTATRSAPARPADAPPLAQTAGQGRRGAGYHQHDARIGSVGRGQEPADALPSRPVPVARPRVPPGRLERPPARRPARAAARPARRPPSRAARLAAGDRVHRDPRPVDPAGGGQRRAEGSSTRRRAP